jgi:cytochrome c oxidase subunit 3/cytochrome o ubiquinol oxidase subunit 3
MSDTSLPQTPAATGVAEAPGDTTSAKFLMVPPPVKPEQSLNTGQWGMIAFLLSEVAFFSTLIVAYIAFMGKDTTPPTPKEALSFPLVIVTTFCLLSSSGTIHLSEGKLHRGDHAGFCRWWALTILLGVIFLLGTGYEWRELIKVHHLTISRNMFGTTYYTLVGFHGLHVTGGVIVMSIFLGLALRRQVTASNAGGVQLVSWYWHFVDVVWIAVFTVVYLTSLFGR